MNLKTKSLFKLRLQLAIDYVAFVPLASIFFLIMAYGMGYRIKDIKKTRSFYKEISKDPRPLMICSNHMTYIDSIVIIWMFGHPLWYLLNFAKASWNLPNAKYAKNIFFLFSCYVGKCIFVRRRGGASHINEVLDQTIYVLRRSEVLTIFPEGRRTPTGRFDSTKLAFGPGKIFSDVENCRVLCLYLRGDKQKVSTGFPPRGSVFDPQYRFIVPKTTLKGYEGYKDIVSQIGQGIKDLEDEYFRL